MTAWEHFPVEVGAGEQQNESFCYLGEAIDKVILGKKHMGKGKQCLASTVLQFS